MAKVQYAVTLKDAEWTVFQDGEPIARGLTRSAAVKVAEDLAFAAEERGEQVELVVQDYFGGMQSTHSGGA